MALRSLVLKGEYGEDEIHNQDSIRVLEHTPGEEAHLSEEGKLEAHQGSVVSMAGGNGVEGLP
jgi:hypothetical protein